MAGSTSHTPSAKVSISRSSGTGRPSWTSGSAGSARTFRPGTVTGSPSAVPTASSPSTPKSMNATIARHRRPKLAAGCRLRGVGNPACPAPCGGKEPDTDDGCEYGGDHDDPCPAGRLVDEERRNAQ